jgi:hypothetical protein
MIMIRKINLLKHKAYTPAIYNMWKLNLKDEDNAKQISTFS